MTKILAENMLRFGPRDLSEQSIQHLKLISEAVKPITPEDWPNVELRWFSCSAGDDYDRKVENKSVFELVDGETENPRVKIISVPTEVHEDPNAPEGEYYSIQTCVMGLEKNDAGKWVDETGGSIEGLHLNLVQYGGPDGPYHLENPDVPTRS